MPDPHALRDPPPLSCSRCSAEPRARGQRWGRACAREYARQRRQAIKLTTPVRPAELPALLLRLVNGEDQATLSAYFRHGAPLDMARWALRFAAERIRTEGYVTGVGRSR